MKRFYIFILTVLLFAGSIFALTPKDVGWSFDLEAHRGGRGLRPENTIAAFKYALEEVGVTTLELDLGVTKDNILVVSHDSVLSPQKVSKDGKFVTSFSLINSLTLDEIRQYDVGVMRKDYYWPKQVEVPGEKMPTFEEVLKLVKNYEKKSGRKIFINAETKVVPNIPSYTVSPEVFADLVVDLVKKYDMENTVMIQSFYWKTLTLIKEKEPKITTVALVRNYPFWNEWTNGLKLSDFDDDVTKMARYIKADVISPYYKECDSEMIEKAHENGLLIVPWTIDNPEEMTEFINMGVDGIVTDYPDVLRKILVENGISVPDTI